MLDMRIFRFYFSTIHKRSTVKRIENDLSCERVLLLQFWLEELEQRVRYCFLLSVLNCARVYKVFDTVFTFSCGNQRLSFLVV